MSLLNWLRLIDRDRKFCKILAKASLWAIKEKNNVFYFPSKKLTEVLQVAPATKLPQDNIWQNAKNTKSNFLKKRSNILNDACNYF